MKSLLWLALVCAALLVTGTAMAFPSCSECDCNTPCNTQCWEFGQTVLTTCGEIDFGTGPCIDSIGCNWNPPGSSAAASVCSDTSDLAPAEKTQPEKADAAASEGKRERAVSPTPEEALGPSRAPGKPRASIR